MDDTHDKRPMSTSPVETTQIVEFLLQALCSQPINAGLPLDPEGWAEVPYVLRAIKAAGFLISRFDFEAVIRNEGASLFTLSVDKRRIRALRMVLAA